MNYQEINRFLTQRIHSDITNIWLIGAGEWSQAYEYKCKGTSKVIRFSRLDDDFRRDSFAYDLMPRLPIPKIEDIGNAFGGYYAISTMMRGKPLDGLDAVGWQNTMPTLLKVLGILQETDTSKTSGFGIWNREGNGTNNSWKEYLTNIATGSVYNRISGWEEKLASVPEDQLVFDQAYQELLKLAPYCPELRCVVHNDLLNRNVLVQDHQISAVLDWGCALYGDFVYDLAMLTMWQFYYPAMADIDIRQQAKAYFAQQGVDLSHFNQRLTCYQLHIALDSMTFNAFKGNRTNMELTKKRIREILQ